MVAVGAVTEHGCLAEYSNTGQGLDLVAPGGGTDAPSTATPAASPTVRGPRVFQFTFTGFEQAFGLPSGYEGTSMAAPHVSATAALMHRLRRARPHPTPAAIEQRLKATARDLGAPGYDTTYGWGLLDAGAATAR